MLDVRPHAFAAHAAEVRIGGHRILGPIDLLIGAGERWVVLGPNGTGKTTLLLLAGARRLPSSGTVRVLGETLGRIDIRELHPRIGHCSHTLADGLAPGMTALGTVLTGRHATLAPWMGSVDADDRRRALRRLEEVGCAHLSDRPLATCSQGERQRVLLARALYARPELLILDEPAAGLDLPARERLIAAIEAAMAAPDGPTLLMATHHLEEVPPSATHAALLRRGRLVAAGPIEDVLTSEHLGACFGLHLEVGRRGGRWWSHAVGPTLPLATTSGD